MSELDALRGELKDRERDCMIQHDSIESLKADIDYALGLIGKARAALDAIASREINWAEGVSHHMNALQGIAEVALSEIPDFSAPYVRVEPKDEQDAERAKHLQQFLNWKAAEKLNNKLIAIAAEVNAVGNDDKDPGAAIEAIGNVLGEPF